MAVGGVLLSSLFLVNTALLDLWQYTGGRTSLQQDLRVSMESVVNHLNRAVKIKKLTAKEIVFLNKAGEEKHFFFRSEVGLHSGEKKDNNYNKFSSYLTDVNFNRSDNLLFIELTGEEAGLRLTLNTAVKLPGSSEGG
jgi:hypothetical protein